MPTFLGQTLSSYFKRILQFGHSGNSGTPTGTTNIQAGDGVATSLSLSDDVLSVQPVTDNTTGTMLVKNQGGSNILAVDTTNSKVLLGASQLPPTNYAYFGVDGAENASFLANTHYMIPFASNSISTAQANNIGTGTDPDTSLTIATTADNVVNNLWYIPDNITIDSVTWLVGADAGSGDVMRVHLMSYAIDISNNATSGDLSSGVVVADGADITSSGYDRIHYQSMTVQSANVDQGRAIVFTFRSDSVTSNHAIQATIKYHVR